ncbi:toxin co-regulated pilus biosynthesis Q family protein [Actimicrobium sp. CCI2.3]|uniref:toxin co-regulated pilus biosynthesis Q family protein n=1 Tax=Actimicrobium sp. CCI2.3 TaxID=3048616 RepID=UPI002AB3561B|nr:toxin co-regulated pilus biosynthesis Q family protein [Actimicrobium sp. CCI2.3]MDY7573519.1 toxin co-regulated pilus biosynthesis Q family protein [Actimicrobium sp. CCI2.3]MEB0022032.1 toxin co-regulated pilus biosynthesis Q family protein [Actimicrobium sp. CCI2.3]
MQFRLSLCTTQAFVAMLIAASGFLMVDCARADTEIQWFKPTFTYQAKNRDLQKLLANLAKAQHLKFKIAPDVTGLVTGNVSLPPQQVLDALAKEHHFSWQVTGNLLSINKLETATGATDSPGMAQTVTVQTPASNTLDPATPMATWTTTPADKTLQNALARWSLTAGWQLIWELPQDISIEAAASINGSFEDAVSAMANSMQSSETPIVAIFFEGNRVLRITAKGVQQ